MIDISSPFDFF